MLGTASTVKHSPSCLMKIFIFHFLPVRCKVRPQTGFAFICSAKTQKLTCLKPSDDTTEKLIETSTESKVAFSAMQKLSKPLIKLSFSGHLKVFISR